ncbi:integrase arm-type DNA-binding domain-containing protein [Duganella sp. FT134W]|uniref:Integrase arm-type DNA-binding domain-containing protein n=1 Tax=Duganella margarita TaxID=2692170 RepID=A0A7X4KJE7_9BURK|nr:integrase arm-type DNA-binding domain-containing protein [Duganella margarita]MYM75490.1 integrase arm-type DNA-binding domain-containing protein [Duganella margarita]
MPLTDLFIRKLKHSGKPSGDKHSDGRALYLLVKESNKYWRMNYRFNGKHNTLAFGTYPEVSLAEARELCADARKQLRAGIDPKRRKSKADEAVHESDQSTFEALAREWLAKMAASRSAATQDKVQAWLEHDLFPFIGALPVAKIKPRDILGVIQRVEARGAVDSAHRIKQVCGQILRYGVALGWTERDVTPDLKGALMAVPRTNFAAITEPKDLAVLLRSIYAYNGHIVAVTALKLTPLLFVRPGELRAAEWCEFDLDAAAWRIPAAKMKMKTEHMVPLCTQAVALLRELHRVTGHGKFVFPSLRTEDACMSENTINAALRGMGYPKEVMTAHGFRATARTILDEVLNERVDLIEHQLAHRVIDPNGRAYNRTAHLPARAAMMQRWADYLDKLRAGAEVIPIRPAPGAGQG